MVFQYKQVTLTGHKAGLNVREKPEKILVPLIEENGETWEMATSGSRYMFFEKLAIPMLSGSELLQKPDASDEIHDAVRKFSMLFVTSVIQWLFWQHHRQPNVVWSVSFCTDLLWQDIFGYEPEGPGTELLLKGENTGLINFPYSRGFIAVYASADSRWPILPQERIALWAENRWGDRMQVDKSWVITGKSHKPATMYTMLKGASTGFHHLEILSVGEVCIKNGHAVCQDVICRVRSCFRRLKAILKNCWQLRPELRIHCSEYHGYTPDFAWLLHSLTPEMTGQAVWWVVFLL